MVKNGEFWSSVKGGLIDEYCLFLGFLGRYELRIELFWVPMRLCLDNLALEAVF